MKKEVWYLLLLAVCGALFLGKGLTGLVVSESCCFPPDCAEENICDSGSHAVEQPSQVPDRFLVGFGFFLIAAVILYIITNHRKPAKPLNTVR